VICRPSSCIVASVVVVVVVVGGGVCNRSQMRTSKCRPTCSIFGVSISIYLPRNAEKKFLIGQSSRSNATYRPTICRWLLVPEAPNFRHFVAYFPPSFYTVVIVCTGSAQVYTCETAHLYSSS